MLEAFDVQVVNRKGRTRSARQGATQLLSVLLGGLLLSLPMRPLAEIAVESTAFESSAAAPLALSPPAAAPSTLSPPRPSAPLASAEGQAGLAVATFAGGCFWCMEPPFDKLDGVRATVSGYTGGLTPDPDYKSVSRGITGHAEAVQVTYDPTKLDYATLLDVFWHNIDPVARDRQFCDVGSQYRTAIFYHDAEQARLARASREAVARTLAPLGEVATEIVEAGQFFPAEAYHQDYYLKNPIKYRHYRHGCGRDRRLKEVWRGR